MDDGSNVQICSDELAKKVRIIQNHTNQGRIASRNLLAEKANFDWILFIDADMLPANDDYLRSYETVITQNTPDICVGGYSYDYKLNSSEYSLRYNYGLKKESLTADKRNKRPYKVILSGNMLIKKRVYKQHLLYLQSGSYGMDNIIGAIFKTNQLNVLHIDNAVLHLGLEKNVTYLSKKREAARLLVENYRNNKDIEHQNDLLSLFIKSKKIGLSLILSLVYKSIGKSLEKFIIKNGSNINILQFYRLSYMCYYYHLKT